MTDSTLPTLTNSTPERRLLRLELTVAGLSQEVARLAGRVGALETEIEEVHDRMTADTLVDAIESAYYAPCNGGCG
jgi:uncharacterized coiled-coil protein SlyX